MKRSEVGHEMVDRALLFVPPEAVEDLTTVQRRAVAMILLQQAAFHEAGHAAVSLFFGKSKPHTVTIAKGEKLASCQSDESQCDAQHDNTRLHESIVLFLAGHAADSRLNGKAFNVWDVLDSLNEGPLPEDARSWTDLTKAFLLANGVAGTPEEAVELVLTLADRANEIMEMPAVWQRVDQLAAVLLKCGTVEADQIEEILGPLWCAGIA